MRKHFVLMMLISILSVIVSSCASHEKITTTDIELTPKQKIQMFYALYEVQVFNLNQELVLLPDLSDENKVILKQKIFIVQQLELLLNDYILTIMLGEIPPEKSEERISKLLFILNSLHISDSDTTSPEPHKEKI